MATANSSFKKIARFVVVEKTISITSFSAIGKQSFTKAATEI